MNNISKKTCFPSARKVLDFDLNGQIMRKTEVPEGNWVPGCSPDHSTIRPKILSLKSEPSPKDKSERLASRRKVVNSGFHSLVVSPTNILSDEKLCPKLMSHIFLFCAFLRSLY